MLDAAGCLSASTHFVHWAAKPNLDTHTYTYTYRAILAACSIYANDLKKVAFVGRVAWHYFPMTFMANRQSCLPHCRKWTKALLSAWLHAARRPPSVSRLAHSSFPPALYRLQPLSAEFLCAWKMLLQRSRAEFHGAVRIFNCLLDIPVHTPHFSRYKLFCCCPLAYMTSWLN